MKFPEERIKAISQARGMKPVRVTLVEKIGVCPHNEGDSFLYHHPMFHPQGICGVAAHSMGPFVQRCADGIPSWEKDAPSIYRIHCPSKKGTIWKIERAE